MMIVRTILLTLLFFSLSVSAQRERSPFFFLLDTSVPSSGIAGGGVAGIAHDPTLALINPALISSGVTSTLIAVQAYPGSQLPGTFPFSTGPSYYYSSFMIAKQFGDANRSRAFRLGAAIGYARLNSGEISSFIVGGQVIGSFQPLEMMPVYSVAAGTHFYVDIDFGLSYKRYIVENTYRNVAQPGIEASADAMDFGFILSFPLAGNRNRLYDSKQSNHSLKFTLGYAQRNIGGDILYSNGVARDPLPRLANMGIGFHYRLTKPLDTGEIVLLRLSVLGEAEDALLKNPNSNENFEFHTALADINVFKHVFGFQSDEEVTHKRGLELEFFETLRLSGGVKAGERRETLSSFGLGVNTSGLHKWLARGTGNPFGIYGKAINVQYHFAYFGFTEDDALSMHSLTLSVGM